MQDERKFHLSQLAVGDRLSYLYDFGDDWTHRITVESARDEAEAVRRQARALPGRQARRAAGGLRRTAGVPVAAEDAGQSRAPPARGVPGLARPALGCRAVRFGGGGRQEGGRDAKDLAYLFQHVCALYPTELLYERHAASVEAADYDLHCAALSVLGAEVAGLLDPEETVFLTGIIGREADGGGDGRLTRDLHRFLAPVPPEGIATLLSAFGRGLEIQRT